MTVHGDPWRAGERAYNGGLELERLGVACLCSLYECLVAELTSASSKNLKDPHLPPSMTLLECLHARRLVELPSVDFYRAIYAERVYEIARRLSVRPSVIKLQNLRNGVIKVTITSLLTSRRLDRLFAWIFGTHYAVDDYVKRWPNNSNSDKFLSILKVVTHDYDVIKSRDVIGDVTIRLPLTTFL